MPGHPETIGQRTITGVISDFEDIQVPDGSNPIRLFEVILDGTVDKRKEIAFPHADELYRAPQLIGAHAVFTREELQFLGPRGHGGGPVERSFIHRLALGNGDPGQGIAIHRQSKDIERAMRTRVAIHKIRRMLFDEY